MHILNTVSLNWTQSTWYLRNNLVKFSKIEPNVISSLTSKRTKNMSLSHINHELQIVSKTTIEQILLIIKKAFIETKTETNTKINYILHQLCTHTSLILKWFFDENHECNWRVFLSSIFLWRNNQIFFFSLKPEKSENFQPQLRMWMSCSNSLF